MACARKQTIDTLQATGLYEHTGESSFHRVFLALAHVWNALGDSYDRTACLSRAPAGSGKE